MRTRGAVLGGLRGRRRWAPAEARAGGALRGARVVVAAPELRSGWGGGTGRYWGAELPEATSPTVPKSLGAGAGFGGALDADSAGSAETQGRKGARAQERTARRTQAGEPCSPLPKHPSTAAPHALRLLRAQAKPHWAGAFIRLVLAGFWGSGHPRTTSSHQARPGARCARARFARP